MKTWFTWSLLTLMIAATGCNSGHGPDSLFAPKTTSGCVTCHNSTSGVAPDPLVTNGSGTYGKHIGHVQSAGIPCEWCHFNYSQAPTHMNGTLDTGNPAVLIVFFDSVNSSGTWTNDTGPGTGTCATVNCHAGNSLDWYGTSYPVCAACHFMRMGPRRPVVGVNGDFAGNSAIVSRHVTSTTDPAPEQCQVCHEMTQHMAGTVRLNEADTGATIVYSAASPTTIEPFCLSCHDTDGSQTTFVAGGTPTSPFNDGSIMGQAPNRASVEIKDTWNKTYGHKQQGLTCIGNGNPNTGCHGNGHGTAYVGLLAKKLTLPYPLLSAPYEVADEGDYELCFNCHQGYPRVRKESILGVKALSKYDWDHQWGLAPPYYIDYINFFLTGFRDRYDNSGKFYDDSGGVFNPGQYLNLHYYHLQDENWWFYSFGIGNQGGWSYRDSIPSAVHCLTCHNVHGSNTPWGMVHDEMLYSHNPGIGSDQYGMIGLGSLQDLNNYPISCLYNCHYDAMGITHNWFEPSGD